jgi:hypothetical protein
MHSENKKYIIGKLIPNIKYEQGSSFIVLDTKAKGISNNFI